MNRPVLRKLRLGRRNKEDTQIRGQTRRTVKTWSITLHSQIGCALNLAVHECELVIQDVGITEWGTGFLSGFQASWDQIRIKEIKCPHILLCSFINYLSFLWPTCTHTSHWTLSSKMGVFTLEVGMIYHWEKNVVTTSGCDQQKYGCDQQNFVCGKKNICAYVHQKSDLTKTTLGAILAISCC